MSLWDDSPGLAELDVLCQALLTDPNTRTTAASQGWLMPLDRWIQTAAHGSRPGAVWPWTDKPAPAEADATPEQMDRARDILRRHMGT